MDLSEASAEAELLLCSTADKEPYNLIFNSHFVTITCSWLKKD